MPFACIFVPDFPVEAVLRAEPDLRVRPVAVLEGKPPLQKVLGVNEKARQIGIEPGMSKIQVEPCTDLTLRARSLMQEAAAHAALLDCAQSFSPRVEDTAPDTAVLDLAGLESLFGPVARIARDLARRASDLGLEVNVAAASNPDTAVLAARGLTGVTIIPDGKEAERLANLPLDVLFPELHALTSKTAAELPAQPAKPKSPQLAQNTAPKTGKTPASLSKEISAAKTVASEAARFLETFDLWGIRNLHALAALPDIALSQRLGQSGLHLQQLARGSVMRSLVLVDSPLVFEEAIDLDHPLVLLEPLAFLLSHMLGQLCARLTARALAAQELQLQLTLDQHFYFVEDIPEPEPYEEEESDMRCGESLAAQQGPGSRQALKTGGMNTSANSLRSTLFTSTLQLPVPILDAKVFLKLLQLDLNAHPPGAPILKIHLSAKPARPRSAQAGLFQPPTPEPEKLELTLARIAGMVGSGNVGSAELLDSHSPESFRMQHFVAPPVSFKRSAGNSKRLAKSSAENTPDRTANAPITALRIFRPPLEATITLREGKPVHLACTRRKELTGDILWMAGPWRSSGDWWEADGWSRDEWDIAIQLQVASTQLSVGKGQLLFAGSQPSLLADVSPSATLALYRLVHDLVNHRWFVEGTYD